MYTCPKLFGVNVQFHMHRKISFLVAKHKMLYTSSRRQRLCSELWFWGSGVYSGPPTSHDSRHCECPQVLVNQPHRTEEGWNEISRHAQQTGRALCGRDSSLLPCSSLSASEPTIAVTSADWSTAGNSQRRFLSRRA